LLARKEGTLASAKYAFHSLGGRTRDEKDFQLAICESTSLNKDEVGGGRPGAEHGSVIATPKKISKPQYIECSQVYSQEFTVEQERPVTVPQRRCGSQSVLPNAYKDRRLRPKKPKPPRK